jgi:hypothetical protein
MKTGDLVRFREEIYKRKKPTDCGIWESKIGLLLEYNTWEKVASVLCDGKVLRVRAEEIEKAGKKDIDRFYSAKSRKR